LSFGPVWFVLNSPQFHRIHNISVRRERVAEVRRWLANYQALKDAIEAICELNRDLLRPGRARTVSKESA
jgi:hypothetical protein